jgi:hypothetical protein
MFKKNLERHISRVTAQSDKGEVRNGFSVRLITVVLSGGKANKKKESSCRGLWSGSREVRVSNAPIGGSPVF